MSSIEFADGLEWQGSKVYVIGDMKELGDDSISLHERAGNAAAACGAEKVFFFGDDSKAAFAAAQKLIGASGSGPELYHTAEYEVLEERVLSVLTAGDLLLIKGSRSMNMERLLQPLAQKFGEVEC